jgi:outer membrane protein OmpA-like peptidoglycan-associated protein
LNNVFFDFSKATLRNESFGDLDRLVKTLNDSPEMKIEIGGHTDNVGTADANLTLSQNRSQSVVDYLVSKGISKNRLVAKGYGMSKPTANNASEEGRQLNRRVEITILSK